MVFSMLIGIQITVLADGETVINILHTNDIHGRLFGVGSSVGIDKVAEIRASTPNAILVDAGDAFDGRPLVNLEQGINAVRLMVAAGYRVMAPGNHDFNFGSDRLLELAGIAADGGLEIVSANVFHKETGNPFLPATTTVDIDGVKVGFFGLTTITTPVVTHPLNVATLEFRAYKQAAESAIAALRGQGAQVIIALAHFACEDIQALIEELDDKPDVVIEGHDHHLGSKTVGDVLIAGAGQYLENLGQVSITVSASGEVTDKVAILIPVADTEEIEGNPEVRAIAEEVLAEVEAQMSEVFAVSEVFFSSARGDNEGLLGVRNSEQPIGNLIADAMRVIGETDIALMNGGGIREDLSVGDLTKGGILSMLPFGNYLVIVEVTPAIIFEVMEHALAPLPNVTGGFPHFSGMRVVYTLAGSGDKVVSIEIDGKLLDRDDDETVFTMGIHDFMAAGGDGFAMLEDMDTVAELGTLEVIVIQYITEALNGVITAENVKVDGRLTEIPARWAIEEIAAAIEAGLVPARMQSRYNQPTTRAEFAELAVILYELVTGEEIEDRVEFDDTDDVNVQKAAAIGVVTGVSPGVFRPDGTLQRQQAATMLARLAEALEMPFPAEAPVFTDNSLIAEYALGAVGAVQAAEVMSGMPDGSFAPRASYQRQQSIATILRLFSLVSV
jgi:2',3'-cyclic-nucleotide 2'-phosphodiesterase (5'-nucleotidase family)